MKTPTWIVIRFQIKSLIQKGGLPLVLDYYNKFACMYSKKEGKKYANAEEEINDTIKNIPELEPIKDKLLDQCKTNRERVGLTV